MRFGRRIRDLREERVWRQLDLAEQARIGENYFSDLELERKERCLRTIEALSEALYMGMIELMKGAQYWLGVRLLEFTISQKSQYLRQNY